MTGRPWRRRRSPPFLHTRSPERTSEPEVPAVLGAGDGEKQTRVRSFATFLGSYRPCGPLRTITRQVLADDVKELFCPSTHRPSFGDDLGTGRPTTPHGDSWVRSVPPRRFGTYLFPQVPHSVFPSETGPTHLPYPRSPRLVTPGGTGYRRDGETTDDRRGSTTTVRRWVWDVGGSTGTTPFVLAVRVPPTSISSGPSPIPVSTWGHPPVVDRSDLSRRGRQVLVPSLPSS